MRPEEVTELLVEAELVVAKEIVDDPLLPVIGDVADEDMPELVPDVLLEAVLEVADPEFELVAEVDGEPIFDKDPDALEEALEVANELLEGGPVLEDELEIEGLEEIVVVGAVDELLELDTEAIGEEELELMLELELEVELLEDPLDVPEVVAAEVVDEPLELVPEVVSEREPEPEPKLELVAELVIVVDDVLPEVAVEGLVVLLAVLEEEEAPPPLVEELKVDDDPLVGPLFVALLDEEVPLLLLEPLDVALEELLLVY